MQALYTSARCISCDWPPLGSGYCRCASAMHLRIAASRASPCCTVCGAACGLASITATNDANRPRQKFLVILMECFLSFWLPELGRQPAPDGSHADPLPKRITA